MSKVLTKLRSSVGNMSAALQRIGNYILEQPDKVIFHTVTELAEASGSSEGSVIRFAHTAGYSGFQEFKLSLALDLAASGPVTNSYDGANSGLDDLIGPVAKNAVIAIEETTHLYEPETVREVAARILAADNVDVYGVGASNIIAQFFAYKFIRLGLRAEAFQDPHMATMSAANLDAKSVAIGVSSSGSTIDTLTALGAAKDAGAFTVAVTNRLSSPLSKLAAKSLVASPPESPLTGGNTYAKISQLLVLELLFTAMMQKQGGHHRAVERTAKAVVDKSI